MNEIITKLYEMIQDRIIIIDGSMGALLEQKNLTTGDFGNINYVGCHDYLVLSNPQIVKQVHNDYLKAGADIIETNTFGASKLSLKEYNLDDKTYKINYNASLIAKEVTKKYKDRFVAGSIGPTNRSLTLSNDVSFEEMKMSYYEQTIGLIEGGCDLLFIETGHDTLNIKSCIIAIKRAMNETGKKLPFFLSSSILINGTMLAGQDIESFYISTRFSNPFAIGLNCAVGPKQMKDNIQTLSNISDLPSFIYPNAGLPNDYGEYDESPESFAKHIDYYINKGWINLVGGCCGTTPKHIKFLKTITESKKPRLINKKNKRFAVSGIEKLYQDENIKLIVVGERTNVQGSRKFKRLLKEKNYDDAVIIAKNQVSGGANIIDICVEDTEIDEIETINKLLPKITKAVKVPIMIDSTNIEAIETILKYCQGKSIINSINLESGRERIERIISLINNYGASVIVGMIDEKGMAVTYNKKIKLAKKLYSLLVEKYNINLYDLIFDFLVFTVNAGQNSQYKGSAKSTINALKEFKSQYPHIMTILGISNVSYGLPQKGREVLNSVFLYHCTQSGLDMAIVNPNTIKRYNTISQHEISLSENLIFDKKSDALSKFIDYYRKKTKNPTHINIKKTLIPEDFIIKTILTGNADNIEENLSLLLKKYYPIEIISNFLMNGMEQVGKLFGEGKLIVNEVLESAEVMKKAINILEPFLKKDYNQQKKKILLATVKGDVHDIGKNLVNIIFTSNGYNVIDIGTKVEPLTLINQIKYHNPDIIGLSGLLVKSAKQMIVTAEDLNNEGINIPIIVGGAALTENFVKQKIQKVYSSKVYYAKDVMNGLNIVNSIFK